MQSTYTVTGMTCGHCVNHVTEEVSEVPGVDDVQVSLEDARMVITSTQPIDIELVKDAVAEAGDYTVAPA